MDSTEHPTLDASLRDDRRLDRGLLAIFLHSSQVSQGFRGGSPVPRIGDPLHGITHHLARTGTVENLPMNRRFSISRDDGPAVAVTPSTFNKCPAPS
ncbi:hypothetical protein WME99_35705 [Sorangium sp. So ce136]|uniref:hypothetical protein n=1 Tax=Sorangium sp. So ce136 TaxID=3133284 RepID=UPI003F0ECFA2